MRYAIPAFSTFVVCSTFILAAVQLPAQAISAQDSAGGPPPTAPSGLMVRPAVKGDRTMGVYQLPGCPEYDALSPAAVIFFATEEEAQRAGFHKAKNCP